MENEVKVIIFDWGRTLHDPETERLFAGVAELVPELAKYYSLVLVSLAKSDSPEERRRKIEESGIAENFKLILVGEEGKDKMCEKALTYLGVSPQQVMVVDDRVRRGITWGNHRGATTVWLKKGKFAQEPPTQESGGPSFIISDIAELRNILLTAD